MSESKRSKLDERVDAALKRSGLDKVFADNSAGGVPKFTDDGDDDLPEARRERGADSVLDRRADDALRQQQGREERGFGWDEQQCSRHSRGWDYER